MKYSVDRGIGEWEIAHMFCQALKYKCVVIHKDCFGQGDLSMGVVMKFSQPGTMWKQVEHFLNTGLIQVEPLLWHKCICIVFQNLWITMNSINECTQNKSDKNTGIGRHLDGWWQTALISVLIMCLKLWCILLITWLKLQKGWNGANEIVSNWSRTTEQMVQRVQGTSWNKSGCQWLPKTTHFILLHNIKWVFGGDSSGLVNGAKVGTKLPNVSKFFKDMECQYSSMGMFAMESTNLVSMYLPLLIHSLSEVTSQNKQDQSNSVWVLACVANKVQDKHQYRCLDTPPIPSLQLCSSWGLGSKSGTHHSSWHYLSAWATPLILPR